jgi:hypothetical protein
VHAGLPVSPVVTGGRDFQVVSLPPVERAATIVHRGLLHGFLSTTQLLVRWVDAHGYRFDGGRLRSPRSRCRRYAGRAVRAVPSLSGRPVPPACKSPGQQAF